MATICETCAHFNEHDNPDVGNCVIELPPWVMTFFIAANASREVHRLDTCEFWNMDKGTRC